MKNKLNRMVGAFLVLVMIISLFPAAAPAGGFSDMPAGAYGTVLEKAVQNGLLSGADGKIHPDDNLTRAQMAAMIGRAFAAREAADISGFTDVPKSKWYYADMARAVQMGVLKGAGDKLNPEAFITREEAFVVLARAIKLPPSESFDREFTDVRDISPWAAGAVSGMVNAGYVNGSKGKINPKSHITRGEFAVLFDNVIKQYITAGGTVTSVAEGNVMVNSPGVALKNAAVRGDLIIGDGVGSGDVILEDVRVRGRVVVRGGGDNSVRIMGNSEIGAVILTRPDGAVRLVIGDGAAVELIVVDEGKDKVSVEGKVSSLEIKAGDVPVVLQNAEVKDVLVTCAHAQFNLGESGTAGTITLPGTAGDASLVISGSVANVKTEAPGTRIAVSGKIASVEVAKSAAGAAINVAGDAVVGSVETEAPGTVIDGEGTVEKAGIRGDNCRIDTAGTVFEIGDNVSGATVNGQAVAGGATGTTSSGGVAPRSTGGGGSGGGGSAHKVFAGGLGTVESPYHIATAAQLDTVRDYLDKNFILTADIDLGGYENWEPIGAFEAVAADDPENPRLELAFTGNFDGSGHTISNLTINEPAGWAVGLFGCTAGRDGRPVAITDLEVEDVSVTGYWLVGGVVGYQYQGCTLENVTLHGDNTITGSAGVGGITGGGVEDLIECDARADIVVVGDGGSSSGVLGGGLVECSVIDCTVTGTVYAEGDNCFALGGLAGGVQEGVEISGCRAEVAITAMGEGNSMVGGLVGYTGTYDETAPTIVTDCRAAAEIMVADGAVRVGGLVGGGFYLDMYKELRPVPSSFFITDCVTSGSITGGSAVGNIAGYAYRSAVVNCSSTLTWNGTAGNLEPVGLEE